MSLAVDTITLFSTASTSEQVAAVAAGAKDLATSTFPAWGLSAALILFPVVIGVVIWLFAKARRHEPTTHERYRLDRNENDVNANTYHRDYSLEAAVRWNEAETKARREFAMRSKE